MNKAIKIICWMLGVFLLVILLAFAFLPTWVSSEYGQKKIVNWMNQNLDGHLSVANVSLSWFGGQKIEHFCLKDKKNETIFSFKTFETETSLFYLLFGGRSLNTTFLEDPYLSVTFESPNEGEKKWKGKSNKQRGEKFLCKFAFLKLKNKLFIKGGKLLFSSPTIAPITISDIEVEKQHKTDLLNVQAQTEQGTIKGSIFIEAQCTDKCLTEIQISNFPVAIFDQLYGAPFFSEGIGNTLSIDLFIEKNQNKSLNLKGSLKSDNLTANVSGITRDGKFEVAPDTSLEFILTPKFFKHLIDPKQRAEWELASKTKMGILIEKGIFPLSLKKPNFKQILLLGVAKIDRAELIHKNLGSYSINKFQASLSTMDNLNIEYSGEIQGKEETKLSGKFSITPALEVLFQSRYEGFPVSLLGLVSPQLEKNVRFLFGREINVEAQGIFSGEELEATSVLYSNATKIEGRFKGRLPDIHFDLEGSYNVIGNKSELIGKTIYFQLDGTSIFRSNALSMPFVKGKIFNSFFDFDLRGQIGEEKEQLSPDRIQIVASGYIKDLPVGTTALQDGYVYVQIDGSKNAILAKLDAKNSQAKFEINHFIENGEISFESAEVLFSVDLTAFPNMLFSPLIGFDLPSLLGTSMDLKAKGSYIPKEDPRFFIDLSALAKGFRAEISVAIDGTLQVKQKSPSFISWEMTPERYAALVRMLELQSEKEPLFTLTRATLIELQINQFNCPTHPPEDLGHFLCQSGFTGDLKIGPTTFRNIETHETIVFQEITGLIRGENFSESIDLILSGDIFAENIPSTEKSAFAFDGQMLHFWTESGKLNKEGLTLKGVLSFDYVPVRQLTGIAPIDNETRSILQAILGELVNARIYGEISQLSGPLTIDIKSSNFKTKLPLLLTPEALYLRDYIDVEITLTEAVNNTLLTDINPLFIVGAYSEHPIKVYVEPQDFMIPLRPYTLQGVRIGKAIIDLGKINVRNGGQIQLLMNFLKATNISPEGWMRAWFTPIFMHLEGGVATYKRFDALLADTIHIALWGSVNLINDQVRMTLAIAPRTLHQQLGIKGLSRKDMFQLKMYGTTHKLELDWSAASTRLGFLIAKTATGHIGTFVGGILEQFVKALGEEPSPAPTTNPLPWESLYPSEPVQGVPREAPSKNSKGSVLKKGLEFLLPQ